MGLAEEVLHAVVVEHAEGQPRVGVDALGVVLHVGLLLHPLELPEQPHPCVLDGVLHALLECLLGLFFDEVGEDGVVDGDPLDVVELLDQFETHGAAHSPVAE